MTHVMAGGLLWGRFGMLHVLDGVGGPDNFAGPFLSSRGPHGQTFEEATVGHLEFKQSVGDIASVEVLVSANVGEGTLRRWT